MENTIIDKSASKEQKNSQKKHPATDKKERLAAALRANLRRRKLALNNVGEQQNDEEK